VIGPARLPESLLPGARAQAAGEFADAPASPRAASTVMLLRDAGTGGDAGLEVYLLRRVASMAYAAGMYVFPGGVVDPRDADAQIAWGRQEPAAWERALGAGPALLRGLVCAAVRETFEESGVLLAGARADRLVTDTTGTGWEGARLALIDRSLSFAELLARRRLALHADLLRPWAHWVTPEFEPRRYDTRFFIAALPAGQRTRDVGGEADRVAWARPAEALDAYAEGAADMLPPTVLALRELARFSQVADVLAAASGRRITRLLPRPVRADAAGPDGAVLAAGGGVHMLLPGTPGYPPGPDDAMARVPPA